MEGNLKIICGTEDRTEKGGLQCRVAPGEQRGQSASQAAACLGSDRIRKEFSLLWGKR